MGNRIRTRIARLGTLWLSFFGSLLLPSLLDAQQLLPYRPVELPAFFVPSHSSSMLNDQEQVSGYVLVNRQMVPAVYDLGSQSIVRFGKNQGVAYAVENDIAVGRVFDSRTKTQRAASFFLDGSVGLFSLPRVSKMTLSVATANNSNGAAIGFLTEQSKPYGFFCQSIRDACLLIPSIKTISAHVGAKPEAINDFNLVVGNSNKPFIWTPKSGSQSLPEAQGYSHHTVTSLNNSGVIIGFAKSLSSGKSQIVVWNKDLKVSILKEQMEDTDYLPTDNNNWGYIVGGATNKSRETYAFVYNKEKILDLSSLTDGNPKLTRAHAINNWGYILASGPSATGLRQNRYYVIIPADK